jgi:hypothetical protein
VSDREVLITNVLLFVLVLGLIPLALRHAAARRALVLPLAGVVGYMLARIVAPYLQVPQRYIAYTLPLFMVVFFPASAAALAGVLSPTRWAIRARPVGGVLGAVVVLVLLGGRGNPMAGYTVALNTNTRIYEFVRGLPKDVLVAGWPGGTIDDVPYVSRRRAFITRENHMAFHEGYALKMRCRMSALITALFGDDRQKLVELRDTFGVTHLIIDADNFSSPPSYFAPFDIDVKRFWQKGRERGFAVEAVLEKATVFREGKLTVLDLSRL